jgi:putative transposase
VRRSHAASKGRYGAPRIHEDLVEDGTAIGKKRVARLMREAGICGKQPKKFIPTTDSGHDLPIATNTLRREFEPTTKNTVWAGDITFIRTGTCWSYLSVILDLYSRRVVGFHLSTSLSTEGPLTALKQAYWARKPAKGLLVHHDRGCQYASEAYRQQLTNMGATLSMSRTGNCWDNAPSESFFATLKRELGEVFISFNAAQKAIHDYMQWYNEVRRHSHNEGISPLKKELVTYNQMVA